MTLPRYRPMLAVPWPRPFNHPAWRFEVKWDGVRVLVYWDGRTTELRSRTGNDLTETFPELAGFRWDRPAVVDGEIVALTEGGAPSFQRIQGRLGRRGADARRAARTNPVTCVLFDVLFDGEEIVGLPLEERQARLERELPAPFVRSDWVEEAGEELFEAVTGQGLEGIVGKRMGSPYRPGVRSPDWRKVAVTARIHAVVGGFTPGEGGRSSTFGALLLGLFDGGKLRYIGSVGTGFDDTTLRLLRDALYALATERSPFHPDPALPGEARWVEPGIVVAVEFKEWTSDGRLRAPSFKGVVTVPPEEVTWESEGPGQSAADSSSAT